LVEAKMAEGGSEFDDEEYEYEYVDEEEQEEEPVMKKISL